MDFTRLLAEQGHNLVLTARRTEPMKKLAEVLRAKHGIKMQVEGVDLGQTGMTPVLKQKLNDLNISRGLNRHLRML